jgi:predicted YcjX-like family ATPase
MANIRWLPPIVAEARGWLFKALDRTDLTSGSTVWLAVTGLSRSGKTVLITSLVHNLLSAQHNPNRMTLFKAVGEGRLVAAQIEGAKAHRLPRFPYRHNIEIMAESRPDWPGSTADISEIGIDVHYAPAKSVGKLWASVSGSAATVSIRIVDYPGEWLLDLPMLTQSFAEWSRSTLGRYRVGARAEAAAEFLSYLAQHPYDELASDEIAKQAHDVYCAFLLKARDQHGLNYLQPGRFLCRGSLGDVPYLWFAPLDVPDDVNTFAPNTLGALMEQRFEVYKREVVARFYEDHFRRYSRQIVLVDVLHALLAGREAFDDTRIAIEAILQSYRYGGGSLLSKLLGGSHIDKVLFAATKADHVPDIQRDHLAELLRNMAAFPAIEVKSANAQIEVMALASATSTADDTQEIDGQRVHVVVGRPVGSAKQAKFFVGNVPIRPPRPDAWGTSFLNVPVFEPPVIDPSPVEGVPHINLDLALEFLLGDRLR